MYEQENLVTDCLWKLKVYIILGVEMKWTMTNKAAFHSGAGFHAILYVSLIEI